MKRMRVIILCAAALLLSSCAKPVSGLPADPGESSPALSMDTGTRPGDAEDITTVVVLTDAAGQTVTDSGGHAVTSIVAAASPTEIHTITDAKGGAVTDAVGKALTTVLYATTTTAVLEITRATPTRTTTTTSRASSTRPTTTTIAKPTTTTSKAKTTTTAPRPADPWRAPYNVPAIYADCRKDIERLGMTWNEDLRLDNAGWANPLSTVVNTYYPEQYYLHDDVLEMIAFYKIDHPRASCRIWFEPDVGQNYLVYFLEEY